MEKELVEAIRKYKEIKEEHKEERKSFLEELAEATERMGKGKKASHLRQLTMREEQREMFRRLKYICKTTANLATTFVTITNSEGDKTDITEKEQMEETIINENRKKYHQSEKSCPFLKDPLLEDFGDYGEGYATEEVREGSYVTPEEIDEYTKEFLLVCAKKEDDELATFERSAIEYKRSWNKMNEKISSIHLHFGHFKAACRNDLVMMVHYILAEIPFRSGYSLNRWQKATNVMILKE